MLLRACKQQSLLHKPERCPLPCGQEEACFQTWCLAICIPWFCFPVEVYSQGGSQY